MKKRFKAILQCTVAMILIFGPIIAMIIAMANPTLRYKKEGDNVYYQVHHWDSKNKSDWYTVETNDTVIWGDSDHQVVDSCTIPEKLTYVTEYDDTSEITLQFHITNPAAYAEWQFADRDMQKEQDTLFQDILTDCYEACGKDTDKITAFLNDALIHSGLSVTSVSIKETYPYPNFNKTTGLFF